MRFDSGDSSSNVDRSSAETERPRISRRAFLRGAAATAGAIGAASLFGPVACSSTGAQRGRPTPVTYRSLHTRRDLGPVPVLHIAKSTDKVQDGYLCITPQTQDSGPHGPTLFDTQGRLVWFHPVSTTNAANFHVAKYKGNDVLAWYEGSVVKPGYGRGACVLYDEHYAQVARIEAGGGYPLDLHELTVTPQDTALIGSYVPTSFDLTAYGGVSGGVVLNCVLQEIDIATGDTLFTWRALDHIKLEESLMKPPKDGASPFDYFHLNAIDVDRDGNLLISARNTSALYKINRTTGDIMWRLGGASNRTQAQPAIKLQPASESFWFQHDVRRNADGSLSIFDDGGSPYHHPGRGLVFNLDETAGTATVREAFGAGMKVHVDYQGSTRLLANGNWLVGWGSVGRLTEFTPDGQVALDASFAGNSYRALPAAWHGRPSDLPAIAVQRSGGGTTAWASWNGATDVARWRLLGGADANSLAELGTFNWRDFETEMTSNSSAAMFAVEALDSTGQVLGRSAPVTAA